MRYQQLPQPLMFVRFDEARLELGIGCHRQCFAQQHGLSDAAQANRDEALGRAVQPRTADCNPHLLQQVLATAEFGWRRAGAGGVGVLDRVHCKGVYRMLQDFLVYMVNLVILASGEAW